MEQKKNIEPDCETLTDRGFLIPADVELNLDFLTEKEGDEPITCQIGLNREEHLELIRAIIKKNYMEHEEEFNKEECCVTIQLGDYPLTFRYYY